MNIIEFIKFGKIDNGVTIGDNRMYIESLYGKPTDINAVNDKIVYYNDYQLKYNDNSELVSIIFKFTSKRINIKINQGNKYVDHYVTYHSTIGKFIYLLQMQNIEFKIDTIKSIHGQLCLKLPNNVHLFFLTPNDHIMNISIFTESQTYGNVPNGDR
ncbi:MAG: hypothetical protein K9H64_23515 [Bacteroidales bacterium]|nr:hypothetical protein [Bacteroidales bacterium]MCF8459005.1 hypothetical protein [Bacteroidales bacterium]